MRDLARLFLVRVLTLGAAHLAAARPFERATFGIDPPSEITDARVAVGIDGTMLFLWQSGPSIRAQLHSQTGTSLAAPITLATGTQPRISPYTRGGYVAAYVRDDAGKRDMMPDACRTSCLLPAGGDRVVDTAEACDDGTASPCNGRDVSCHPALAAVRASFAGVPPPWPERPAQIRVRRRWTSSCPSEARPRPCRWPALAGRDLSDRGRRARQGQPSPDLPADDPSIPVVPRRRLAHALPRVPRERPLIPLVLSGIDIDPWTRCHRGGRRMTAFRTLLVTLWLIIAGYTAVVAANHGFGLLPVFFGDIAVMEWPGQFNLDFLSMLTLSALWVSWRHHFSGAGLVLGVLAFFGGAFFLTAYLFVASMNAKGDVRMLLLGKERVAN